MLYEKAAMADIERLTDLRIAYLEEDSGKMSEDVLLIVRNGLPDYFEKHLNKDLTAYVARNEGKIVACALLLVVEKPLSPAFISGKTGMVLNVYTCPDHRRKGHAKRLMQMLMSDAAEKDISPIELKATDDGHSLYRSLGFEDNGDKYHEMKWQN